MITLMATPRLLLFVSTLLLPVISVRATWNYEYGPDEYVTVAKGISPDGKIAITAHGSGELGDEHFHLYLTDASTGKKDRAARGDQGVPRHRWECVCGAVVGRWPT